MVYNNELMNNYYITPSHELLFNAVAAEILHYPIRNVTYVGNTPDASLPGHKEYLGNNGHFINGARESSTHEDNIDYLFSCVDELKKNLDCLLNSGDAKIITIELMEKKIKAATKQVILPSGKSVYAGFFQGKLIVAYGNDYYIEHHWQQPLPWRATLAVLLTSLVQGGGWRLLNSRPGWMQTVSNWFTGIRDPLVFPQAYGQALDAVNPNAQDILYSAQAVYAAHLSSADDQREADHNETTTLSPPSTLALSSLPDTDEIPGSSTFLHRLIIEIEGHEFKIAPANAAAKQQLQDIVDAFFQQEALPLAHSLPMVLEFDAYIGRKMANMFHNGLYLKEKNNSLNLVIFKMFTENIVSTLSMLAPISSTTAEQLEKYTVNQITIGNYVPNLDKKMLNAMRHVDIKIIKHVILHIRNKEYIVAEQDLKERMRHAKYEEMDYYKKTYHYLVLFQQALDEYRLQLIDDGYSPLAKILFLNTQQIYSELISGGPVPLADCLVKLKYYYIFEYTRSNDISIYSSNFIVPGEISDLWHVFAENENEFIKEEMDELFVKELMSYIYQHKTEHQYLNQLLDFIELSLISDTQITPNANWVEANLKPFHQVHELLSNLIENNYIEQDKFIDDRPWYNDFVLKLHNDKTNFILLPYLTNFQRMFIDEINYILLNEKVLKVETPEQLIIGAKVEAVRDMLQMAAQDKDDYRLLVEYYELEKKGHLDLSIKAAALWFISQQDDLSVEFLVSLNVAYVFKQFISAQQQIPLKHSARQKQPYNSVFQLKPSSQIESTEGYYKQFKYYKDHYSLLEAQRLSVQGLNNSNLNYIDIIYPPKEIISFKVYSRNYVENPLYPFTSVYLPAENLGYLSFATLYSDRHILISTLNGFTFIADIDTPEKVDLILRLNAYWTDCDTLFGLRNRPNFPTDEATLASLFPKIDANSNQLTSMIELLLRRPEEESIDIAASDYELVAVKNTDLSSILSPYTPTQTPDFDPLSTNISLIANLDYLNQATLIAITNELKETLYESTWLEYIGAFIPFFSTLCRHWYDEEHEISFEEVIFDIYDLLMALVSLTGQFKKISENTFKHALNKAILQEIRHDLVRNFIIKELIKSSPEVGYKMTKSALSEVSSFYNIIHPSGKALTIFVDKINSKVQEIISIANVAIRADRLRNKILRQPWKSDVNKNLLQTLTSGVSLINSTASENYYVINDNDYFPVYWDKYNGEWRVINSHGNDTKNFAIPVTRSQTGNWVASAGQLVDLKFSSFSFGALQPRGPVSSRLVSIEPTKIVTSLEFPDNELINFHKEVLHFYLQRQYFSQRILSEKVKSDLFLDHSYRFFSIRREIIAMQQFNGFGHNTKSLQLAAEALHSVDDNKVLFRAICGWRSKHDLVAETYFALAIRLKRKRYILDLSEIRSLFGMSDPRDVFTEDEWIMMMNNLPSDFELIKFKDFEFIEDSKYFDYREATAPHVYINRGYLIKEPTWYRPLVLKNNNKFKKKEVHYQSTDKHQLHGVVRALRNKEINYPNKEEFLSHVLLETGLIDTAGAANLQRMIKQAKTDRSVSQAILDNPLRLSTGVALLKLNPGKLVAIYNNANHLVHLLLCLGDGQFIAEGNDFFGMTPKLRPTLIIAEQMGTFTSGVLKPHYSDISFILFAGDAFGAIHDAPVMRYDLPHEKIPQYSITNHIIGFSEQPIPRERVLLGKECQINFSGSDDGRLIIKLSGAPFMVNHMDIVDFSDIIKGLFYLDDEKFALRNFTEIKLVTSFSGYGRRHSMAQTLANELGVKVKTVPHIQTEAVRLRRPEWFCEFERDEDYASFMGNHNETLLQHKRHEYTAVQAMRLSMHDLMQTIREVKRKLEFLWHRRQIEDSVGKNIHQHIPFIYIDILQMFYPRNIRHPHVAGGIVLSPQSDLLLDEILNDYAVIIGEDDIIIEQILLDVILSIPEFNYLSEQFNSQAAESAP